jgi:hypothetical protein
MSLRGTTVPKQSHSLLPRLQTLLRAQAKKPMPRNDERKSDLPVQKANGRNASGSGVVKDLS